MDRKEHLFSTIDDDLLNSMDISTYISIRYGYHTKLEGHNSLQISQLREDFDTLSDAFDRQVPQIRRDVVKLTIQSNSLLERILLANEFMVRELGHYQSQISQLTKRVESLEKSIGGNPHE